MATQQVTFQCVGCGSKKELTVTPQQQAQQAQAQQAQAQQAQAQQAQAQQAQAQQAQAQQAQAPVCCGRPMKEISRK